MINQEANYSSVAPLLGYLCLHSVTQLGILMSSRVDRNIPLAWFSVMVSFDPAFAIHCSYLIIVCGPPIFSQTTAPPWHVPVLSCPQPSGLNVDVSQSSRSCLPLKTCPILYPSRPSSDAANAWFGVSSYCQLGIVLFVLFIFLGTLIISRSPMRPPPVQSLG